MRLKNGNYNIFDEINTQEKAYWLGFLYADGYICRRDRRNNEKYTYETKLSLAECDTEHLEKFIKFIEMDTTVKFYKSLGFGNGFTEARVVIYNKHFGETLYNTYGICPKRNDLTKILNKVPIELYRHFIRGIFDGDGSITFYKMKDTGYKKASLSFTTQYNTLYFIMEHLYNNKITFSKYLKLYKRHKEENRDGDCRTLTYSGTNQAKMILDYLYVDSNIFLERKYQKYINEYN